MEDWNCNMCKEYESGIACTYCDDGSEFRRMTNADRIRAMTDEELAKFIKSVQCYSHYGNDCGYPFCHSMRGDLCNGIKNNTDKELLEWLQSEAK